MVNIQLTYHYFFLQFIRTKQESSTICTYFDKVFLTTFFLRHLKTDNR